MDLFSVHEGQSISPVLVVGRAPFARPFCRGDEGSHGHTHISSAFHRHTVAGPLFVPHRGDRQ
jgi:hypothetical protein